MLNNRLVWPLTVFLFLVLSLTSRAQPLLMAVPDQGYPPYLIVNNGQVSGILHDVLQRIREQAGFEFVLKFVPEKRSQLMLDQGKIQMRMESPVWVNEPSQYLWSEAIVQVADHFVLPQNQPAGYLHDERLHGAHIITHLGYGYPTLQSLFDAGLIIRMDFSSERAMLNALLNQEADKTKMAVMDRWVARWLIHRHDKYHNQFRISERVVDTAWLHFQFADEARSRRWLPIINQAIQTMKQNGELANIIDTTLKSPH